MDDQGTNRDGTDHWTIFWRGARRGMKFAAIACVAIWAILNGVIWVATPLLPSLREHVLNYFRQHGVLTAMGSLVLQLVIMVFFVATPSALIMGLVSLVRSRGAKPMDSDK
jgi:hypothetical protein